MSVKTVRDELRELACTAKKVQITRRQPPERVTSGFIVAVGEDLVLVQAFHDFYPEGLVVLRVSDVTHTRSDEHERLWERMLEAEGIRGAALIGKLPPLDDMRSLLSSFKDARENVIVECEDADEPISDFYIGRVLDVEPGVVVFANFDALGRWDPEPHRIELEEITNVQFETPYLKIFSKHVQGACPFD